MSESESPYTLDPFDNFRAINGHQTLLLDDKLYITPGFARVYVSPGVNRTASNLSLDPRDRSFKFLLLGPN
ncbi:uncharacterized protein DFL_006626 [Arthrobotrys flagrans]|uniref:Uncharacterized protein n=1 Tax=Arthrobotrys flagrans TaxID=97331 RepID=A0A436ZTX6_ARTFL|nr:hypothetical protein DFL_006626 [Arthrobotrys flagrans]